MLIRQETASDREAIARLTQAAFAGAAHSSETEHQIIDRLRDAGSLSLSLVLDISDQIVAHVAFSPVLIEGKDLGWFGLGPVAVDPNRQGEGLGSAVIKQGLAEIAARGAKGCVVLGEPDYYQRFGFLPGAGLRFEGAPAEYFMRLDFSDDRPTGAVTYQPAFYD